MLRTKLEEKRTKNLAVKLAEIYLELRLTVLLKKQKTLSPNFLSGGHHAGGVDGNLKKGLPRKLRIPAQSKEQDAPGEKDEKGKEINRSL